MPNNNLLQISISGMPVIEASLTLWSFISTSVGEGSQRLSSSVSTAIRFLFLYLNCFIVENVLSQTYTMCF